MPHFNIALSVNNDIRYNIVYDLHLFDKMTTNYPGIIECIKDDFEYLCDERYIEKIEDKGEVFLYNNKYKFLFHNETPEYPNLSQTNIKYYTRIQAFRKCLQGQKNNITFYLMRHNTSQCDLLDIKKVLHEKYPKLNYQIIPLFLQESIARNALKLLGFKESELEMDRLNYWYG